LQDVREFLEPLAEFFAGKRADGEQPHKPPVFLREMIQELDDPWFLALAAHAPLLDGIFRGWKDRDDPSLERLDPFREEEAQAA
jgi:hypothetical protein